MVALIYNNIPLSYAQDNSTMNNTPMTNLTQTEEEEEYATAEAGHSAEEEEEEEEMKEEDTKIGFFCIINFVTIINQGLFHYI